MSNMRGGGPAFPEHWHPEMGWSPQEVSSGMTLRDYFAAKVMASICSYKEGNEGLRNLALRDGKEPDIVLAQVAYSIADAMLKVREETS